MFDKLFIKRLKNFGIFIVIYTIIFTLFFSTISYTLPFVLGLVIAIITIPLTRFLRCKLKLKNGIASIISTLLVFVVLFFILSAIIIKVTSEVRLLLISMPNFYTISNYIQDSIKDIRLLYDKIDPTIVSKLESQLSSFVYSGYDLIVELLKKTLSFAIGLPVAMMIIFITLIATFFFTRDLPSIKDKFLNIFSVDGTSKVRAVWSEAVKMITGYLKAYSTIVTIGFLETFIGFSLIHVKYALLLSIVASFFDVLPILGMAAIYFPLAGFYFITGKYLTGILIILLYLLVTVVRQILEPKLVSSSLGLHPIAVLAAIFIGIKAYGFIGMIYLLSLMVFYNILRKTNIL